MMCFKPASGMAISDQCTDYLAGNADASTKLKPAPSMKATKSNSSLPPAHSKTTMLTSRAYLGSKIGSLDVHNGLHKLLVPKQ